MPRKGAGVRRHNAWSGIPPQRRWRLAVGTASTSRCAGCSLRGCCCQRWSCLKRLLVSDRRGLHAQPAAQPAPQRPLPAPPPVVLVVTWRETASSEQLETPQHPCSQLAGLYVALRATRVIVVQTRRAPQRTTRATSLQFAVGTAGLRLSTPVGSTSRRGVRIRGACAPAIVQGLRERATCGAFCGTVPCAP